MTSNQTNPKGMIKLRRPIAVALALALTAEAPMAAAAIFQELSEAALADMRGKFVVGNRVQYFGMSVTTQWTRSEALADSSRGLDSSRGADSASGIDQAATAQSNDDMSHSRSTTTTALANGDVGYAGSENHGLPNTPETHQVNLKFELDNSGPETKVAFSVGGTLGSEVQNAPAPPANAALSQIDGAVQAIQVEGSDNIVRNNVGYAVIPQGAAPSLSDAQVVTTAPVDQTFVNGDMVTHVTASNGLGFTITSQGNQVTQQLGMNPVTNNSQLLQAVQLNGNGQQIVNNLMLQVAFDNAIAQRDSLRFRADRIVNLL